MKKIKVLLISIFTLIISFSAFGLAACTINHGDTTSSNEQNQPNTNQNNNNSGNNTNDNNENKEKEFSSILDKILTDKYYTNMVDRILGNSHELAKDMLPIPYKFLRQHGHNVDAYLDGTLDVFASSYIYDNDKNHIYVSVKAENVSNSIYGNYYTNYVLKYPLTNQEYDEYTDLCDGEYLQGLLFIQELDNQKTPEIVNKINVQKATYDRMITQYTKSKNINFKRYSRVEIDIYSVSDTEIEISVRNGASANKFNNNISWITLTTNKFAANIKTYDNAVTYVGSVEMVNYKNLEEYQSSLQDITSFSYGQNIQHAIPYPNDYPILH